jgi:hypothetical protein
MAEGSGDLIGFAYGEDLEQGSGRSLGYRLLAPTPAREWCPEVEALARRLQAAPYPDHWPSVDLFCSLLLAKGGRLVALARYGLLDHTPTQRRGGLELVGLVGPGDLGVSSALSLYRWLLARRAGEEDLHRLGGAHTLAEVLARAPAGQEDQRTQGMAGPVPVLPVRLWHDGAFLFAAGAPGDPDHHLRLLDLAVTPQWQWLPLVGADFPLQTFAQRGPLVAWTPHLAGVAVKLERKEPVASAPARKPSRRRAPVAAFAVMLLGLLGGNLWYMVRLHRAVTAPPPLPSREEPQPRAAKALPPEKGRPEGERDRFARALYQVIIEKGGEREWRAHRAALLQSYAGLARRRPDLALGRDNESGRLAVAVAGVLAGRSANRIEESVRQGLSDKGFSDRVIQAACEHVREQLAGEVRERPAPP